MMHMNNNTTPWPKKKVVSIPVHFVGSEMTTNNPAIQIQKVLRGFLVRNNMRRVKAISVELEKIEEKLCDIETKELIKREQKERLKVSESIMNLLLKLDSVRVFNYYSAVRDYRKSVIKKAIALQELVDQIHMMGSTHKNNCDEVESNIRDSHLMEPRKEKEVGVEENGPRLVGSGEDRNGEGKKMEGWIDDEEENMEVEEKDNDEGVEEESVGTSMVEENCLVKVEEEKEEEDCKEGRGEKGDYENNKNKEMLERMMEDNERMMVMMAQLFERNEMQTKLLTSLSQRVEQLERAYTCDKLRRKKRRNADTKHKQAH